MKCYKDNQKIRCPDMDLIKNGTNLCRAPSEIAGIVNKNILIGWLPINDMMIPLVGIKNIARYKSLKF